MTAHCPHCNIPLDPTHAPVARVRNARVVTFCSSDCAEADGRGEPAIDRAGTSPAAVAALEDESHPIDVLDPAPSAAIEAPSVATTTSERSTVETITFDLESPIVQAKRSPARQKNRRQIIAVLGIIFLGGMAIAIIEAVSPSKPTTADARKGNAIGQPDKAQPSPAVTAKRSSTQVANKANADKPSAKSIIPEVLYADAVAELRKLLKSTSPRVRREAAMALARIKDPTALKLLRKALDSEPSALVKIKVAYVLARAGDIDGRATLIKALKQKRLDVRLDAARSLIQLGDKRGREQLRGMMSYAAFSLGAAALLARIGDKKGFGVLKKALKHRWRVSVRMRAAVALGLAGDKSVLDRLRKIVKDQRYRVRAAHALAALNDRFAIPELVAQLDMPSLRVGAALSLRRLGHKVRLEPVASGLYRSNDISRTKAAEAIMILVGPKSLAERD